MSPVPCPDPIEAGLSADWGLESTGTGSANAVAAESVSTTAPAIPTAIAVRRDWISGLASVLHSGSAHAYLA
jgi:hypothetical protein